MVLLDLVKVSETDITISSAVVNEYSSGLGSRFPDIQQRVEGDGHFLSSTSPSLAINGIGIPDNSTDARVNVFERYKSHGWRFPRLVHPSATVSDLTTLDEGSQIMAGVILQAGSRVGENAVINTGAIVDHDCEIGAHSMIAPGAIICGNVTVGSRVIVGSGAVILPGVVVPNDTIVPANTRLSGKDQGAS